MKKIIYIAVSLFALTLFQSCEKEIKFKGEIQDPMIVMNGVITAGEEIRLRLSESQFFLNAEHNNFKTIKDAVVTLFVNDELKETLQYKDLIYGESSISRVMPPPEYENPGVYVAEYLPKAGDQIRIEAKHPSYNTVEASLIVPDAPIILSADTVDRKVKEYYMVSHRYEDGPDYGGGKDFGYGDDYEPIIDTIGVVEMEQFNLKIKLKDPASVRNFYRLGLYVLEKPENESYFHERSVPLLKVKDLETEPLWTSYLYAINDPIFNKETPDLGSLIEEDDFYGSNPYLLFDDALFDGENYTLNFIVRWKSRTHYYDEEIDSSVKMDEILLRFNLTEMTKEYRYFLQALTAYDNYFPLFSEPVQIYNNVKGGIGIVGSETTTTWTLRLK